VGAISVHGVNGAWGVLCVGIFADGTYGAGWNGVDGTVRGILYGAGGGSQLLAQCVGVLVCATWNIVAAGVIFWAIGKVVGGNRVSAEVEVSGLDIPEMGIPGYPEFGPGASGIPEQFPEHATSDKAPAFHPAGAIAHTSAAGV
jgi:Amt family ammonium transporter